MRARLATVILTLLIVGFTGRPLPATPPSAIVTGHILDSTGEPVSGAIVKIMREDGTGTLCYAISDNNGRFRLNISKAPAARSATVSLIGYKTRTISWGPTLEAGDITLEDNAVTLNEVYVKTPKVYARNDTVVFDVGAFAKSSDANIEDVIKRLPGMSVDQNGQIFYNGQPINKFYIQGLDMLQGRYSLATRNIQPKDVATIDLYENHQPVKAIKDIADSDRAALNIKLKNSAMLQPIGSVTAGTGFSRHMLGLSELSMLLINQTTQNLISLKANNTGTNYASEIQDHLDRGLPSTIAGDFFSEKPFGSPALNPGRYARNTSMLGSVNHLSKLGATRQLSLYADWMRNTCDFTGFMSRIYENPGTEAVIIDQRTANRLVSQAVNSAIQFTLNSDKTYLSDVVKFSATFRRDNYDLRLPYSLTQQLNANTFKIDNRLTAIFRRGKNAFRLQSSTSFSNIPFNHLRAEDLTSDTLVVSQNATGLKLHNQESTSFSRLFSRNFEIGLKAHFTIDYDRLHSYGVLGRDYAPLPQNNLEGTDLKLTATPYASYHFYTRNATKWLSLTLSANLTQRLMHYKRRNDGTIINYNPFLPYGYAVIKFTPEGYGSMSLSATAGKISGTVFRTFLTDPVYNTYRSNFAPGNGSGSADKYMSTALSYGYDAPVRGLTAFLSATYNTIKSEYISSLNATPDINEISFLKEENTMEAIDIRAGGSKHFLGFNDMLKVSLAYSRNKSRTGYQQRITNLITNTYALNASNTRNFLSNKIASTLTLSVRYADQDMSFFSSHSLDWSVSETLSVYPVENLSLSLTGEWKNLSATSSATRHDFFLNAKAGWNHKKWKLNLTFENLTNRKWYSSYHTRGGIMSRYLARLNPVSVLATAGYSF